MTVARKPDLNGLRKCSRDDSSAPDNKNNDRICGLCSGGWLCFGGEEIALIFRRYVIVDAKKKKKRQQAQLR